MDQLPHPAYRSYMVERVAPEGPALRHGRDSRRRVCRPWRSAVTRPNPNRRVREAKRRREIRGWQELAARNRERRDRPETETEEDQ